MASVKVLTAREHQPIPITPDGAGWSVAPAEAERLSRIGELRPGFCELGHRKVKLAQFCGVVGLGERVLEVLPKIQDGNASAEECRGVLLRLLRLTEQFPQFQHQSAGQHLRRVPLLEVFIAAFFDAVAAVVRGGLLEQYQDCEEDLGVLRGRIAVKRQIGVHANRPDMLACAFDELTADNVWNRVLKKAIRATRPWIRSLELNRRWVELMSVLDEVDDGRLGATEASRLNFNRQADRYGVAIDWARWILALLAPALRAGRNEAPALLFDMNKLFESAIAAVLRRRSAGVPGVRVSVQDTTQSLATVIGEARQDRAFTLRPDLVIYQGASVTAIADTKWKTVERDRWGRPVPGEADVYQMLAYAAAYQCADLTLIYPWQDHLKSTVDTEIRLPPINGCTPILRVLCVDVQDDTLPLRVGGSSGILGELFRAERPAA